MANPYFNAVYYLQNNPDLMAAGVTVATAWDHYVQYGANEAYVAGGTTRAPNDWFNARFYLENNSDLIAAGVTPETALDHFSMFGANELRSPNAGIAASPVTAASLLAYVNANADIAAALGVTVPATALTQEQQNSVVAQYYGYGINEDRPSEPSNYKPGPEPTPGQTFTLTTAAGEKIVGTAGNDEIRGVMNSAESNSTLNIGDTVDGGAGADTLNLTFAATAAPPAGIEIKNVEIVNLNVGGSTGANAAFLKSSLYSGVEQLWQIDSQAQDTLATGSNTVAAASSDASATITVAVASVASDFGNVIVADGVTVGFKGSGQVGAQAVYGAAAAATQTVTVTQATGAAATLTASATAEGAALEVKAAAAAQKVISIALDGVGTGSKLAVNGEGTGVIETVNVSGSVAKASSTVDGSLSITLDNTATATGGVTKTFDGDFTSGVKLTLANNGALTTIDLAGSTGGVEIDLSTGYGKLKTVTTGTGADKVKIDDAMTEDLAIDLGAGNDVLTIAGAAATAAGATAGGTKEVTVTLGEGKDTVKLDGAFVSNIADVDAIATNGLITISDFKIGEDSLTFASTAYQGLTTAQIDKTGDLKAAAGSAISQAGAGKATIFELGGNTYVVVDSNNSGTFSNGDGLIELTGVDASDLVGNATSFVLI